jgi:hypothetical protein
MVWRGHNPRPLLQLWVLERSHCRNEYGAWARRFERCFEYPQAALARDPQTVEMSGQSIVEATQMVELDVGRRKQPRARVAQDGGVARMLLEDDRNDSP